MTVLAAAVLGIVVGLLTSAYWRQAKARRRERERRQFYIYRDFFDRMYGCSMLVDRLRRYTLR